ncbi:MAG: hypothetical protein J2P53_18320 [Bradyrhizobiaceae bacterium]|nr:hypothetical protein [Bradyrhizobiaceae bacterium]
MKTPISPASEAPRARAERPGRPSVLSLASFRSFASLPSLPSLRSLGDGVVSLLTLPLTRVVMIFVVGFVAGMVWQSSNVRGTIAGWSPYLEWLGPPAANASYDRIRADLVAARQNLDRLGSDLSRLEAQGANVPRRRTDR